MATSGNKRAVIVGVFVLLAIIILVAGIFILGGKQKRFEKTILVRAIFDNVSGLKLGNNVWFSGVKIGTIKSINFSGTSQVEVTMKLEQDVNKYIHKDSKARLGSESLIGNKIIEIYGGNPNGPIIDDNDKLEVEKSLETSEIMATLQENNKNLVKITGDLKQVSREILHGKGMVGTLLTDSALANNFRSIVHNLHKTTVSTALATNQLTDFTAKLNNKNGLANKLMTDTVIYANLNSSVFQLKKTTTNAAIITDSLKMATSKLTTGKSPIGVLLNDEKMATQIRNTMGKLETTSVKLDENMEALQHNFLLRGYFRKKAKNDVKMKIEKEKEKK